MLVAELGKIASIDFLYSEQVDAETVMRIAFVLRVMSVCAFGATARVAKSAVNDARAQGIKAGLFRPKTLWPFPVKEINEAAKNAKKLLSVEMSMGQMIEDIKLAINCSKPVEFFGRTGGVIPTPAEVLGEIKRMGGAL